MKRFSWLVLAFGTMAFASVALVGCGDEDEQTGCEEDADCGTGEICVNGTCAEGCTTADDCSNPNHFCSGGQCANERERNICFLPCKADEDCAPGDFCNLDFCGGIIDGNGRCEARGVTGCDDDDDCGDGQVCDVGAGECVDACTSHDDCDDGFLCNTDTGHCVEEGAECEEDTDCGDGQVCEDGVCVDSNACVDNGDCYGRGNFFCGDAKECVDISCGQPGNTCERCSLGVNDGDREESGPVLFGAQQIDLEGADRCQPDSPKCGEGAKLYCEFSFQFFDPDGDFEPTNDNLWVVSGSGAHNKTFGVAQIGSGIGKFGACFGSEQTTVGTAIFVRDAAGNASNTICTNGTR